MDLSDTKDTAPGSTSRRSALTAPVRSIARRFSRSLNSPWTSTPDEHEEDYRGFVGAAGEKIAGRYLWVSGCKILYRNYRPPKGGEVDIVVRDRDVLAFVEVKTRTSLAFGRPATAVNREKQQLITRGAMAWLRMLDFPHISIRFDIVEVLLEYGEPPEINWIRNAFNLPDEYVYG